MALERQKHTRLQAAERLVKQGKIQEALSQLDQVRLSAPSDLLNLNRVSDMLARQGHNNEAIRYYLKIAGEFTSTGFYPKAVAIHKKILRIDPEHIQSIVELGDLYVQQRLPGEAKRYLLHAAELCLKAKDFARAREVYERLIEADPADPRHRARLAETRAAEGDNEKAGEELILLADSLFTQGKPGDAEQTYRRAAELLPARHEPWLGVCKSMAEQGRAEQALAMLEERASVEDPDPSILGELALYRAKDGGQEKALDLLRGPKGEEIPPDTLLRLFRHYLDAGTIEKFWDSMDPVFEVWAERVSAHKIEALYGRLGTLQKEGHIPALVRLSASAEKSGDRRGAVHALEQLIRAYRSRSLQEEAEQALERLKELAPHSSLIEGSEAAKPPAAEDAPDAPRAAAPDDSAQESAADVLPVEAEAPAVPLNRGDEEFVAGRLTQAEILEKYGLHDQALQQVREVTEKFPGHVHGQERLVTLLRGTSDRAAQCEALAGLALARRAAGDTEGAAKAAGEAGAIGRLRAEKRRLLESLGLVDAAAERPPAAPEPRADAAPVAAAVESPSPPPPKPPQVPGGRQAPAEPTATASDDGAVVIDFDAMDDGPAEAPLAEAPPAAAAPPPGGLPGAKRVRPPREDMLKEIRLLVRSGEQSEARKRVQTLRTLGYSSPELDEIGRSIEQLAPTAPPARAEDAVAGAPPQKAEVEQVAGGSVEELAATIADTDEDDDLSTITAALESELFADDNEPPVPEAQTEQSLEDVFAAFREHVAEEVGTEDYRTHYDLGIAYKEMGLLDEAIGEFQVAVRSSEILREAAIMLAICNRERGDQREAARWYRRAIEAPGGDTEAAYGLRYEFAELLLEAGNVEGALEQFRDVLTSNPSFRDVRERVEQLESRKTT